jgi:CobQ-like glutamine amidotransferase family enzyme
MIYMGPMTEKTQQKVIDKLLPLKDRLHELIGAGTIFLMTGNALEVFGKYIETDDGEKIQGLGLLDLYAKRDMLHRHNSECEAEFNGMTILGFKTQFTQCFPKDESHGLFTVVKGMGMNMKSKKEGIRVNNFMGTYLVGPLLIMNPEFTEYIVKLLGFKDRKPYLYNEVTEAFKERKEDFDRNIPKKVKKYRYM